MTQPLKLFVIDDHDEVREALVIRLCAAPGVLIVGEAKTAETALEEINALKPDGVLIETKRADGRGLELVNCIAHGDSGTQVIALTSYPSEWERWAAHRAARPSGSGTPLRSASGADARVPGFNGDPGRAGAAGYFLKDVGSTRFLLEQIRNTVKLAPPESTTGVRKLAAFKIEAEVCDLTH